MSTSTIVRRRRVHHPKACSPFCQPEDRFGFQTQGATAPSYIGTQILSEYQSMDQRATSQECLANVQSPNCQCSCSVTTPACPPAPPVCKVGCIHVCQWSSLVAAQFGTASTPTGGSEISAQQALYNTSTTGSHLRQQGMNSYPFNKHCEPGSGHTSTSHLLGQAAIWAPS